MMWHLTAKAVQALADCDWACRACHRWISKTGRYAVSARDVSHGCGRARVLYRYHEACAPAGATVVAGA